MNKNFSIADVIKIITLVISMLIFYFGTVKELETRVVRLETNQTTLMEYVKEMRSDIKELINRK
jgi:hypothetical protein